MEKLPLGMAGRVGPGAELKWAQGTKRNSKTQRRREETVKEGGKGRWSWVFEAQYLNLEKGRSEGWGGKGRKAGYQGGRTASYSGGYR